MKKILSLLLIILSYFSINAQYEVDWVNAPLNPILQEYTRNHFKILDDVSTRKDGSIQFLFNKNGTLTEIKSMMPTKYFYDEKGYLKRQESAFINFDATCDNNGRVILMKSENGEGLKYSYNAKGLWTQLIDLKSGNTTNKYFYDEKGRLTKEEFFDKSKIITTTTYSYAKLEKYLEIKIVRNQLGKAKTESIQRFNNRGDCILKDGEEIKYTYDNHQNILTIDNRGFPSRYSYTYFDVGNTTIAEIIKQNDCMYGDCVNGYGSIMIGDKKYKGFFENGKPNGAGLLIKDTYIFLGTWKEGINNGFGTLTVTDSGTNEQGYFKNFILDGRGLRKVNGKFQYGNYSAGKLVGPEYKVQKNNTVIGCAYGDCEKQYGRYNFANGTKFTGFFKDGNLDAGIFSDSKKNEYNGEFKNGKQEGFGKQTFNNGDIYAGDFKNGMRHGKGFYSRKETSSKDFFGIWEYDKLIKNFYASETDQTLFLKTPEGPGILKKIEEKSGEEKIVTAVSENKNNTGCIAGDCENGYGVKMFGGRRYMGFFTNGKQDGPGSYDAHGLAFISHWRNGINSAYGMFTDLNSDRIEQGYFYEEKLQGVGTRKIAKGFLRGKFKEGRLLEPLYSFRANDVKTGCTIGNCIDQYGKYVFPDNSFFIGFFTRGEPDVGIFRDDKNNEYNGELLMGKPFGFGQENFSNGDSYVGFYKFSVRDGKGSYVKKGNPSVLIAGIWQDDKLIKDLSLTPGYKGTFQPTISGPGKINKRKIIAEVNNSSDLRVGKKVPEVYRSANTSAISKLYPGYPGSDDKFLSKKIEAEAFTKGSDEAAGKYAAEKIMELYALDKYAAFAAVLHLSNKLLAKTLSLLTPEFRRYMKVEAKKITDEYHRQHPAR